MTTRKSLLCALLGAALLFPGCLRAGEPVLEPLREKLQEEEPLRPVATAVTFEIGRQSALDTYLSPIRYRGLDVALGYERLRAASFAPEKWFTRHNVLANFATMTNESGSGSMLSFYLDYSFAMLRRWQLLDGLWLAGGGEAALTLGGLYNQRNSNNPATAKAAIDLGATAMASYHLRVGRLPLTFRYQVSLPVVGAYFRGVAQPGRPAQLPLGRPSPGQDGSAVGIPAVDAHDPRQPHRHPGAQPHVRVGYLGRDIPFGPSGPSGSVALLLKGK